MGLKDYRLWAMGQLDSNEQRPTTAIGGGEARAKGPKVSSFRDVALQVAFERQTLKPVFSFDRL
jgi:hypothetical protein